MDEKSLQTLEFAKVLDRLAAYTAFSASTELAQSLKPASKLEEALTRQALTREAALLLDVKAEVGVGGAHDVRALTDRAARSGILTAQEVLAYTRLWKQMKKYLIAPAKPADLPQEYQYREFLEPDQLRLWLSAGLGDMMVSAGLAGVCAREGLLDEVWLMVVPVCLGAGLPVSIGEEVGLRLEESLRFENVWLFNRYEVEQ